MVTAAWCCNWKETDGPTLAWERSGLTPCHPKRTLVADFTGPDKVALVPHQDDWCLRLGLPEEEAELGSAMEASPVSHREDEDAHVALQRGEVLTDTNTLIKHHVSSRLVANGRDQVTPQEVWNVTMHKILYELIFQSDWTSAFIKLLVHFQADGIKVFSPSHKQMLNLTVCMSRFALNIPTPLVVTSSIPSGLPVTEAPLAWAAAAEAAA